MIREARPCDKGGRIALRLLIANLSVRRIVPTWTQVSDLHKTHIILPSAFTRNSTLYLPPTLRGGHAQIVEDGAQRLDRCAEQLGTAKA